MVDDSSNDNTPRQDLISNDVASDLAAAMNDGQTPQPSGDENGTVQTPDEPAVDTRPTPVASAPTVTPAAGPDDLQSIKQQALKELGPLVQHLDQEPEERFDTLMMMLRASDDESLVQPAYEATQKITDEAKRAKALLDVVNEVNYLTRPTDTEAS